MSGSEISQSKISAIKAHLQLCPQCRHEYDSFIISLEKTKEWLAKERIAWEEKEWHKAVQKATEQRESRVSSLVPWPFKKAWAYAMMAAFIFVLCLFVVRPSFIKQKKEPESRMIAELRQEAERMKQESQQEIITMTLVSHETGLKIVWFFNKNFELEVKE
jgi:adenosyl cobinamide kinase/adenosyl cobinamide phosphate guanylyltransferase